MTPMRIVAEPLTVEAWAPFGDVVQASDDPSTMAKSVVTNKIGHTVPTGHKFNRVSLISDSYTSNPLTPSNITKPITSISVIRIGPTPDLKHGRKDFPVMMMERHAASTQAFIPFATSGKEWEKWTGTKGVEFGNPGGMLVLGAMNGRDDKPDLSTLKVFLASPSQGVSYNQGIWHHSMLSFAHADYAVIDTQITTDSSIKIDCEIVRPEGEPFAIVELPEMGDGV